MTQKIKSEDKAIKAMNSMADAIELLSKLAKKQDIEIKHLQLALLSMKKPFNARTLIDGEMVEYRNGEQVKTYSTF